MRIEIDVRADNDAFRNADGKIDMPTIALDLHELVRRIGMGELEGRMRDVNGNTAFTFHVDVDRSEISYE